MIYREGSRGEEVKQIQQALGIGDDGIFGAGTTRAVKEFQEANGLSVDGLVGPNTFSLLTTPVEKETIDLSKLSGHVPEVVIGQIPLAIDTFDIFTSLRLSHFLAQVAHESGNFNHTVENLNYSSKALLAVFGKYFDEKTAEQFHRKPEEIANVVYANRMDNGDTNSGDGWNFRGRGYIQLTGRRNYTLFNEYVEDDIVSSPDLVSDKYPLLSAAWFWGSNNLNLLADQGSEEDVVKKITRRVNGGYHGLEDRLHHFNEFYGLLS